MKLVAFTVTLALAAAGCASDERKDVDTKRAAAKSAPAPLDPLAAVLPDLPDAVWLRFDGATAEAVAPALGATLDLLLPDSDARRRLLARPSDPLAALLGAAGLCAVPSDFYLPAGRPTFVALRATDVEDAEAVLELGLPPVPNEARPSLVVDVFLPAEDADDLRRDVRLWVEQMRSNPTGECDVRSPGTRVDTERDAGRRASARAALARARERRARSAALASDVTWDDGFVRAQLVFPLAPRAGEESEVLGVNPDRPRLPARLTPARLELLVASARVALWARPRALAALHLATGVARASEPAAGGFVAPAERWARDAAALSALTRDRLTPAELEDVALVVTATADGAALALTATPTELGRRALSRLPRSVALPSLTDGESTLRLDVAVPVARVVARVPSAPWGAPFFETLGDEAPSLAPTPLLSRDGVLGLLHAPLATLGASWARAPDALTRLEALSLRGFGPGPRELVVAARFPGDTRGVAAAGALRGWLSEGARSVDADTQKSGDAWQVVAASNGAARDRVANGTTPPPSTRLSLTRVGDFTRSVGETSVSALRRWLLHADPDARLRTELVLAPERVRLVAVVGDAPMPPPASGRFAAPLAATPAPRDPHCSEGLRQAGDLLLREPEESLSPADVALWFAHLLSVRGCGDRGRDDDEQRRAEGRGRGVLAALLDGADEATTTALLSLACELGDTALCAAAKSMPRAPVHLPELAVTGLSEPGFRSRPGFALRADADGLRRTRDGLFGHLPDGEPLSREQLTLALAAQPPSLSPLVAGPLAGRAGALWSLYADSSVPLAALSELIAVHDGRPSWLTLAVRKPRPSSPPVPSSELDALVRYVEEARAPIGALVFGLAASPDLTPIASVTVGASSPTELRALGARWARAAAAAPQEVHVRSARGATLLDLVALGESVWSGMLATGPLRVPAAYGLRLVLVGGDELDL